MAAPIRSASLMLNVTTRRLPEAAVRSAAGAANAPWNFGEDGFSRLMVRAQPVANSTAATKSSLVSTEPPQSLSRPSLTVGAPQVPYVVPEHFSRGVWSEDQEPSWNNGGALW